MESRWQFEQDDEMRWHWIERVGETERAKSADAFACPAECMIDAVRYVVRRRRPPSENH